MKWTQLANDHEVSHHQARTVPINLTKRESATWLLSPSVRKILGGISTPMGMHVGQMDKSLWHFMSTAKTVPMNLIWSDSAQWMLSHDIPKVPRELLNGGHFVTASVYQKEAPSVSYWLTYSLAPNYRSMVDWSPIPSRQPVCCGEMRSWSWWLWQSQYHTQQLYSIMCELFGEHFLWDASRVHCSNSRVHSRYIL